MREYALDGSSSRDLAVVPSFIYALSALPDGFASAGEDRSLRVWARDGTLVQQLPVPAVSVWCVAAVSNDTLACGASDGQVYLFTRQEAAAAAPDVLETYFAEVGSQPLPASEVEGVRVVEGSAAALPPGTTEGEALVRVDGAQRERLQWSSSQAQWVRTGIVSDSVAPSQKPTFEGVSYDYVFDVDIAEGAPPLKLPYNVSENPYVAASRFLERNELPASFLDQVVRFLEKNTQGVQMSAPSAVDPYTGSARYTPAETAPAAPAAAPATDDAKAPAPVSSKTSATLPQTTFLSFATANLDAALAKMEELRGAGQAPCSSEDMAALRALVAQLQRQQGPVDVSVVRRLLATWPLAARFPLLDILRISACLACTTPFPELVGDALVAAEWDALDAPGADLKAAGANTMLALRTLANGFVAPNGAATMEALALEALATLRHPPWMALTKPGRVALATVAFNYSVLAVTRDSFAQAPLLLELVTEVRELN